jgi:hypothetical protein
VARATFARSADLEIGDTAGLETSATPERQLAADFGRAEIRRDNDAASRRTI